MNLEEIKKLNIPKSPGCYLYKNKKEEIVYVGKAADLNNRIKSYWQKSADHTPAKLEMLKQIEKIEWTTTESEIEALLLESNLIKKYQPRYNVLLRDDKRFAYIKVSTEDEIPGVFLTRKIDKSGKYFGPFTSTTAVKETLKALRRIWPHCNERKIKNKPCFYFQIGRCTGVCAGKYDIKEYKEKIIKPIILFLEGKKQTIIKNYELRIKNSEKELKNNYPPPHPTAAQQAGAATSPYTPLSGARGETFQTSNFKKKPKEKKSPPPPFTKGGIINVSNSEEELQIEIKKLKFTILNMRKVLEHTKIISVGEKYVNDVVELAKILGLPKIPQRIEGYDISNIFGRDAVGSMVVFEGGEPNKNEYRKFKIKLSEGLANDVGMLKEVLERRFKHNQNRHPVSESFQTPGVCESKNYSSKIETVRKLEKSPFGGGLRGRFSVIPSTQEPTPPHSQEGNYDFLDSLNKRGYDWPIPDLIIIDGGKGQLNAALSVIKKNKLDISVIAVSKGKGLRSAQAPDKIFFPGESKPLELPLASPALHIIKRVRDEAHRFAISYHKLRRKKRMFGK